MKYIMLTILIVCIYNLLDDLISLMKFKKYEFDIENVKNKVLGLCKKNDINNIVNAIDKAVTEKMILVTLEKKNDFYIYLSDINRIIKSNKYKQFYSHKFRELSSDNKSYIITILFEEYINKFVEKNNNIILDNTNGDMYKFVIENNITLKN